MAAYNDLRFLDAAVTSIIDQSYHDLELIIVDDGTRLSDIFARQAARDRRVRVVTNATNQGPMAAANRGIREARGEIIARLDADDVAKPERLGLLVAALDADPELGIVGSNFVNIDEAGIAGAINHMPETDADVRWTMLFRNPFCHSSVAYRRTCYEAASGYDERWKVSGDHEFWFRLLPQCRAANLQHLLVEYRVNPRGLSATHSHNWRRRIDPLRERAWARLGVAYDPAIADDLSHFVLGQEFPDPDLRAPAYRVCLRLLRRFIGTPLPSARVADEVHKRRLVRTTIERILADETDGLVRALDEEDLAWGRAFIATGPT